MIVRVNHTDLYCEEHGQGEPALLIPGLGSDASTWIAFYPQFESRYRFLSMENRGCGRSGKPPGPYSIEQMAEDALAVLDHFQVDRAHVIAKSMGGMIAQVLAALHPERIRSLVLTSTLMKHDAYGAELLELGRIIAEKAGMMTTYRQAFVMSYSREYCMTNRERLRQAAELLNQMDEREMLRGYLAQSLACEKHDARRLVGRIKAPTLVLAGAEDVITTPGHARELAAAIPGAELVIMPKGGHGVWREFPDEVNAVVGAFLDKQRGI